MGSYLTLGLIDSFAGGVKLSSVFGLVLGFAFLLDHCVVRSFVLRLAHILVPGECFIQDLLLKICDSSLQLTLLLSHGLVDGLTLCVELGVVDSFANFLVRRLVRCLTLLLNDGVVPAKKGFRLDPLQKKPL